MRDGPTQEINIPEPGEARGWVDAVVVGAGPAGLAAARTIPERNLDVVVVESQPSAGGQPRWLYPVKQVTDVGGNQACAARLVAGLYDEAVYAGALFRFGEVLVDIQDSAVVEDGEVLARVLTSKRVYYCRRVVLAIGRRHYPRRLPILDRLDSRLVTYGVPWIEDYAGERVVVVGRDEVALDAALMVLNRGAEATLVMLGDDDGTQSLNNRYLAAGGHIHGGTELTGADRDGDTLELELSTGVNLSCDRVIVQLGHLPARDLFDRLELEVTTDGAVAIDAGFATSRPGIFAVGQVAGAVDRIPVAIGQGTAVATAAFGAKDGLPWQPEREVSCPAPTSEPPVLEEDSESSVDEIDQTRR